MNDLAQGSVDVVELGGFSGAWLVLAVVLLVPVTGVVVIAGRRLMMPKAAGEPAAELGDDDRTIIRSWLAVSLVGGLLLFCGVSFALTDKELRNTLMGGLIAAVSGAVAFYFAGKSGTSAAPTSTTPALADVPDLKNMTVAAAIAELATRGLVITVDQPATPTMTIKEHHPGPNTKLPVGQDVFAILH